MTHASGNTWLASWRLTRRQLELVARGILPREWVTWAKRDLNGTHDPALWYIARTSRRRSVRAKT